MFPLFLFTISGLIIATMLVAKRIEEKRKKPLFVLSAISNGDERLKKLNHDVLHFYSQSKDRIYFWVNKQLPLRAKNWLNKSISYTEEMFHKYMGDIRNSRLLKRDEGISEFFKNISEIEKGNGEINEVYEEREVIVVEEVVKKRTPRKKKLTVIESK